jgi:hypothetical protein
MGVPSLDDFDSVFKLVSLILCNNKWFPGSAQKEFGTVSMLFECWCACFLELRIRIAVGSSSMHVR